MGANRTQKTVFSRARKEEKGGRERNELDDSERTGFSVLEGKGKRKVSQCP